MVSATASVRIFGVHTCIATVSTVYLPYAILFCRWRIVIHGCVDGYSRLVTFLGASDNNRASTVLDLFLEATIKYGVPSRVRCDHGGENVDVCLFMETYRGYGRGSAIRGRSVHNQRIERFWVDMWRGCTHIYYSLFQFLENEGLLNVDNPAHTWTLHHIFLPRLNRELTLFAKQWNLHGIRGTNGRLSPDAMYLEGILRLKGTLNTAVVDFFPLDDPDSVREDYGEQYVDTDNAPQREEAEATDVSEENAHGESDCDPTLSIVDVPVTSCPLPDAVFAQLKQEVDVLLQCDDDPHGLRLYEKVLTYLDLQ